jgi:peptidyl-prolyl cis-trans isomerase C
MKKPFKFFFTLFLASWVSLVLAQAQPNDKKIKELILQDVEKQGLNKTPEAISAMRDAQETILIRLWEKALIAAQPITAEMKAQVHKDLGGLLGNSEFLIYQVFLDNEASAKSLIVKMVSNPKWESLDLKTTVPESTKFSVNKPDWVNISSIQPEFRSVVKALKPGEVTPNPIAVQGGWHVVGLLQTRPFKMPTVEQMDKELINLAERKIVALKLQSMLVK